MKDRVAALRTKTRMIAELRYPAVPQLLDMRGTIISAVHAKLKDTFPLWEARDEEVLFLDRRPEPTKEIVIGYKRTIIALEDPESLQVFLNMASNVCRDVEGFIGKWLQKVSRIGVRFLDVIGRPESTYESVARDVFDRFQKDGLRINLERVDSQAIVVHKYGRYGVGPTHPKDPWFLGLFKEPSLPVAAGIALDIDSFAEDVPVSKRGELGVAVSNVAVMTLAVEEALLCAAGVIGE